MLHFCTCLLWRAPCRLELHVLGVLPVKAAKLLSQLFRGAAWCGYANAPSKRIRVGFLCFLLPHVASRLRKDSRLTGALPSIVGLLALLLGNAVIGLTALYGRNTFCPLPLGVCHLLVNSRLRV